MISALQYRELLGSGATVRRGGIPAGWLFIFRAINNSDGHATRHNTGDCPGRS